MPLWVSVLSWVYTPQVPGDQPKAFRWLDRAELISRVNKMKSPKRDDLQLELRINPNVTESWQGGLSAIKRWLSRSQERNGHFFHKDWHRGKGLEGCPLLPIRLGCVLPSPPKASRPRSSSYSLSFREKTRVHRFSLLLKDYSLFYLCVYMCACISLYAPYMWRCLCRPEDVGSPETGVKVVVSHPMWLLGLKPGSSAREVGALNPGPSPSPFSPFLLQT